MTLKQIIAEERSEFLDWSLPNKNRNYPSMLELADWLSAHDSRLLEAQAKELVERVEKEKSYVINERVDFVVQTTRYAQGLTRAQDIIRTSLNE